MPEERRFVVTLVVTRRQNLGRLEITQDNGKSAEIIYNPLVNDS